MFSCSKAPRFQSTPSARRATAGDKFTVSSHNYFNPRPPRGGRPFHPHLHLLLCVFQSTPSARRATLESGLCDGFYAIFQSTPSARRATNGDVTIKIAGGDFNPRPPRGGRRGGIILAPAIDRFQSTPSARRATPTPGCPVRSQNHFNPRPPRGGRPRVASTAVWASGFQSTPSARRATPARPAESHDQRISIHALREESDLLRPQPPRLRRNFNPRPPRGERQLLSAVLLQR